MVGLSKQATSSLSIAPSRLEPWDLPRERPISGKSIHALPQVRYTQLPVRHTQLPVRHTQLPVRHTPLSLGFKAHMLYIIATAYLDAYILVRTILALFLYATDSPPGGIGVIQN